MSKILPLTLVPNKGQYKYPFLLLGFFITFLLSTVCLANRLTIIGNLLLPGGIFVFVFTFFICDVVGEVYGYAYPRLFIWIGVFAELIFSFVVTGVSHLPFPAYFKQPIAYQLVFDPTIRYVLSGLIALLVGEFVNVYLLAKWKILLRGKLFIVRSFISTGFGQLCLTIIVDVLNYSGKMPNNELVRMMINGYIWKMFFAGILVFPAWLIVRHLKRVENIDFYDVNTNFNPFIFSLNNTDIKTELSDEQYVLAKEIAAS